MTTPNLQLPEPPDFASPIAAEERDGQRALDATGPGWIAVLSASTATPPASPAQGDRYLVPVGATGVWATHARHVAYFTPIGWSYRAPRQGWVSLVLDEGDLGRAYVYGGTDWERITDDAFDLSGFTAADMLFDGYGLDGDPATVDQALDGLYGIVDDHESRITVLEVSSGGGGAGGGSSSGLSAAILADAPTLYYKCEDTSGTTLVDSSGNSKNLTLQGNYTLAGYPLIPGDTSAKHVMFGPQSTATTNAGASTSGLPGSPSFPLASDVTFECLVCIGSARTSSQARLMQLGVGSATAASAADNIQPLVYVTSANDVRGFWQSGNRANNDISNGITLGAARTVHLVMVKDSTAKTLTLFINGVKVAANPYTNEVASGANNTAFGIGTGFSGAAGNVNTTQFTIGHVAVYYGSKLSDARILAHAAAAGLQSG